MKLVLASNNATKLREFKEILYPLGYEIISMREAGVRSDPDEDGITYEGNAQIKAKAVWDILHVPVIADDSGLEIAALNNFPGLFTSRFAEPGKHAETIIDKMKGVPYEERQATLHCAICFIGESGNPVFTHGTVSGYIAEEPRGNYPNYPFNLLMYGDRTLAELSPEERNAISHRGIALRRMHQMIICGLTD